MSFRSDYCALCRALGEEFGKLSPYMMVSLVEFGKVGGYSATYEDLKDDASYCIDLFRVVRSDASFADVEALPQLRPNRLIEEDGLQLELDTFQDALNWIAGSAERVSDDTFATLWERMDANMRALYAEALARAGLDETPPTAHDGENIFVSAGFPYRLVRQIIPVIRLAGMQPVLPQRATRPRLEDEEWSTTKDQIASCTGGVISLVDIEDPAFAPGTKEGDLQLATMMQEITIAKERFPNRLIVVAHEAALASAPDALRENSIFALKNRTMDEAERTRFSELIRREQWR